MTSVLFLLFSNNSEAQQNAPSTGSPKKAKMIYLGQFDAGQPDAGIYKMYDPSDEIVCYILMPDLANRKQSGNIWIYEANSLGSISCVKMPAQAKIEKQNKMGK